MSDQSPAIEDLKAIQEKLSEASERIYEALELAAQLKLKPRYFMGLAELIEHTEQTQSGLLEACQRKAEETNHPPVHSSAGASRRDIHLPTPEEMDRMRQYFFEQMELNRRPSIGLGLGVGKKLHPLERGMVERGHDCAMQDNH